MEILAKRASDASKRAVSLALLRKKEDKKREREQRDREAMLEEWEKQMLQRCNARYSEAEFDRRISGAVRTENGKCMARIASRQEAREKASDARKEKALWALSFFALSVVLFWLTEWTYLPVWAAWTLTAIMVLFVPVLFWDIDRKSRLPVSRPERRRR